MLFKSRKSRSFTAFQYIKGISTQKLKENMQIQYKLNERFRSQSEKKIKLLRTDQKDNKAQQKRANVYQTQIKKSTAKSKQECKNLEPIKSMALKIQNKKGFKLEVPESGYAYLDISSLNNGVTSSKKLQPIIQKNGVILEYPENAEEKNEFFKIEEFTRIMKICKSIKQIQFFKNMHIFKYFQIWKKYMKKRRLENVTLAILPKVDQIYNPNFVEIRDKICKIKVGKFLSPGKGNPISISNYCEYLQKGCIEVLNMLQQSFLKSIAVKSFCALQKQINLGKEQADMLQNDLDQKIKYVQKKLKNRQRIILLGEETRNRNNFYLTFNELVCRFTIFFRKMIYFVADESISLFKELIDEIKQALKDVHKQYMSKKKHFILYLSQIDPKNTEQVPLKKSKQIDNSDNKLKNKIDNMKTNEILSEIFVTSNTGIQLIKIQYPFNQTTNLMDVILESSNKIINYFIDFVQFVKNILQRQNLFDFQGFGELQYSILGQISSNMNQYKLVNFLNEIKEYASFKTFIAEYISQVNHQAKQIFRIICPLLEQFAQFLQQSKNMIYEYELHTHSHLEKKPEQTNSILQEITSNSQYIIQNELTKGILLKFFERKADLVSKLDKLPNCLNISFYSISLRELKQNFQAKIDEIENNIRKYVPENFDKISNEIICILANIDKKISLHNWTIQEFVCSAKGQEQFEEMNANGTIFKSTQGLNKFLTVLSQVSESLYKQKSIKNLEVKREIKRIFQKVLQFEIRKVSKLKMFKSTIVAQKQEIWLQLTKIQNELYEKINNQVFNFRQMIDYFPSLEQRLAVTKSKIENIVFVQNLLVEHCLTADKVTQFASYVKLENDVKMLRQFIQQYLKISSKIQNALQQSYKSHRIVEILEDINEAINECRVVQQSLLPYIRLVSQVKTYYYQNQTFFETARQISYLKQEQLEQIENKKYFDFARKKKYRIRDIYNYQLHQKHSELRIVFLRKYYKRVLSDLIMQFEDFIERTQLEVEIEVIKYVKEDFKKNQQKDDFDDIIQKSSNGESQVSDETNKSILSQNKKKRNVVQASSTQRIHVFSSLNEQKLILTDLDMQLNKLRNTCESLSEGCFKEETIQISGEIKLLMNLIGQLSQEQQKYVFLLKNGSLKGSNFFQDIIKYLEEAKSLWNVSVIDLFRGKNLSFLKKNSKELKKTVENFKKKIAGINSSIQSKIQDRRRQLSLLYLCDNQTVLKIINNPLHFVHQFYSSVDQICVDPGNNSIFIETFYKEELKIVFKNKNIHLNKLRDEIVKFVKMQCFFKLRQVMRGILSKADKKGPFVQSEKNVIANIKKPGRNELIQVSYLSYFIQLQNALKGKDFHQMKKILNKQIQYLSSEYSSLHSSYEQIFLKLDLFVSLCLELRSRVTQGEEDFFSSSLTYSFQVSEQTCQQSNNGRLSETIKNVIMSQKQRSISQNTRIKNITDLVKKAKEFKQLSSSFIISQERVERRKSSLGSRKAELQEISNAAKRQQEFRIQQNMNKHIQTQKQQIEFQKFRVRLSNFFHTVDLSYDLIDPKYLVHYIASQKMLLSLFNSFTQPKNPTIGRDYESILSLSCRLFRLYRKIQLPAKSYQMSEIIFLNYMKLNRLVIVISMHQYCERKLGVVCDYIYQTTQKFVQESFESKKHENQTAKINKSAKQVMNSIVENLPNIFFISNRSEGKYCIKTKKQQYRVVSMQIPSVDHILEMFLISMKSRYSDKLMKTVLQYIKVYQFFLLEIKNEKMNIEDSKQMFLYILQQTQIYLCKEFKQQFEGADENFIHSKIQSIFTTPLESLGLSKNEIDTIIFKLLFQFYEFVDITQCKDKNYVASNSKYKKVNDSIKSLSIQRQIAYFLSSSHESCSSYCNKLLTIVGPAGTGKSHLLQQQIKKISQQNGIAFVNVNLVDEFSKFLITIQTIEQLRLKIVHKLNSLQKRSHKQEGKVSIIYEGFEGVRHRRIVNLCNLLTDPELLEIQQSKAKHIIQIQSLKNFCPKIIINLQIVNFTNIQFERETYVFNIEQLILSLWDSDSDIKRKSSQSQSFYSTKSQIQKPVLKMTMKLILQITDKLLHNKFTINKKSQVQSTNFKFFVNERQFFCMMSHMFKIYADKYQQKLRKLAICRPVYALVSIKKLLSFCLYWTFYYCLHNIKARNALFQILYSMKEFQQLSHFTNNQINLNSSQISLNSALFASQITAQHLSQTTFNNQSWNTTCKSIAQDSFEFKVIDFSQDIISFVKQTSQIQLDFQNKIYPINISNYHSFLFVETQQIKKMSRLCQIITTSNEFIKGVYIIGEAGTGKSMLIKNLLQKIQTNTMYSGNSLAKRQQNIIQIFLNSHSLAKLDNQSNNGSKSKKQSKKNEKQFCFFSQKAETNEHILKLRKLSQRLYKISTNKNQTGASLTSLRSVNNLSKEQRQSKLPSTLLYIDDCFFQTEQSLQGNITHEFLKNLCEHSEILHNQQLIHFSNCKIFYQSRMGSNDRKTIQLITSKWFLFPLIFSVPNNYLSNIFEILVQRTVNLGVKQTDNFYQMSEGSIRLFDNPASANQLTALQKQNLVKQLVSKIVSFDQKSNISQKISKQFFNNKRMSLGQKKGLIIKKPDTWLYQFNYKNIYKTLFQFISILKANQANKKSTKTNNGQKSTLKYGDLVSLDYQYEGERTFTSNFQLLETMIVFNLISRLKSQDSEFTEFRPTVLEANDRQKNHNSYLEKRKQQNVYKKFLKSSMFSEQNEIDLLLEKLSQKRLKIPLLSKQFRTNLHKFQYAVKTSHFILVNRNQFFQGNNFIELACEIYNLKLNKIQGVAYDFDGAISRLSKLDKGHQTCVYLPLQTICNCPEILNSLENQMKLLYHLEYIEQKFENEENQEMNEENCWGNDAFSRKKISTKNLEENSYHHLTYLIEYPAVYSNAFKTFLQNQHLLNYSSVLWLDHENASSYFQGYSGGDGERQQKQQTRQLLQKNQKSCLQVLRLTGTVKNNITVQYMLQLYQKKTREDIEEYVRNMERVYQYLEKQYKLILPVHMHQLLFNYSNYLISCRTFIDIATRCQSETSNKIKLFQSVLSSIEFLLRQYEGIRCQHLNLLRNRKNIEQNIIDLTCQIEKKNKKIEIFSKSGDQEEEKRMQRKCIKNDEQIVKMAKKTENYRMIALKAFERINRTEMAELKYLFNSNFQLYQRLFEMIAIVLGEEQIISGGLNPQQGNLFKQALRKCITDVNIMARIKQQGLLQNKSQQIIKLLKQKLNLSDESEGEKEKGSFMKNIYKWIEYSVKLILATKQRKEATTALTEQTEQLKQKIVQIYQKYKTSYLANDINQLENELAEKKQNLKSLIILSEKQSVKFNKCSELIDKFREFDTICRQELDKSKIKYKNIMADSLIASIQCCFSASLPYQYRSDFRIKYQRFIDKIFAQRDKFIEKRISKDLIIDDLHYLNTIDQKNQYKITNKSSFLLTKEKQRTMNIILRLLCLQNSNHRKLTVIDPNGIFVRQLSMFTNLSYICLNLDQLGCQNILKAIQNVNLVIIRVPAWEWTLQFIKPQAKEEYILDINNYRIKWNKIQIKLNKSQRCIILKDSIESINQLTSLSHTIVYYDLQNLQQNQKIVEKILRGYIFVKAYNSIEKSFPELRQCFQQCLQKTEIVTQVYSGLVQAKNQQIFDLIQHICKNLSRFSLSNIDNIVDLSIKINSLVQTINKQKIVSKLVQNVNSRVLFSEVQHSFVNSHEESTKKKYKQKHRYSYNPLYINSKTENSKEPERTSFESITSICQLSRLMACSFEIYRQLLSQNNDKNCIKRTGKIQSILAVSKFQASPQDQLKYYVKRPYISNVESQTYIDISVLKSAVQVSFEYASLQSESSRSQGQHSKQTNFIDIMLKSFFNFLLLGLKDKHELFFMLEMKLRYIMGESKFSSELSQNAFKLVTLSKYIIEQECEANTRMKLKLAKMKENVQENEMYENEMNSIKKIQIKSQEDQEKINRKSHSKSEINQHQSQNIISCSEKGKNWQYDQQRRQKISRSVRLLHTEKNADQQISQNCTESKITRQLINWQYSKTKLRHQGANFVNTTFQKACQAVYKSLKRIAISQQGLDMSKCRNLIDQQKDITDNERLELYNYFCKSQYIKIIVKNSLHNKIIYSESETKKQQQEIIQKQCAPSPSLTSKQEMKAPFMPNTDHIQQEDFSQSFVQKLVDIILLGNQPIKSSNYFKRRCINNAERQNLSAENIRNVKNIFCHIGKQSELKFLLKVISHSNQQIIKTTMNPHKTQSQSNSNHSLISKQQKMKSCQENEVENQRPTSNNKRPGLIKELQIDSSDMQLTPYYIVYQPTSEKRKTKKQLQQIYLSIMWPHKVFVLILSEEYWLKFALTDQSNIAAYKVAFQEKCDFNIIKENQNLHTQEYNSQLFNKPMQEVKWLMKQKRCIILSNQRQFYGSFPIRNSKSSSLCCTISAKLSQFQNQRLETLIYNKINYSINSLQLLSILTSQSLSGISLASKKRQQIQFSKQKINNGTVSQFRSKISCEGFEQMKKYRAIIDCIVRVLHPFERAKCLWNFQRYMQWVIEQQESKKWLQSNRYFLKCTQVIFLPTMGISQSTYFNVIKLVRALPLDKIQNLAATSYFTHLKLNTFDAEVTNHSKVYSEARTGDYLKKNIQTFKMVSNMIKKKLQTIQTQKQKQMQAVKQKNRGRFSGFGKQKNQENGKIDGSSNLEGSSKSAICSNSYTGIKNQKSIHPAIKKYEVSHRFYKVSARLQQLLRWIQIFSHQFVLDKGCRNYDEIPDVYDIEGLLKIIVNDLESIYVWNNCHNIFLDNLTLPITKFIVCESLSKQLQLKSEVLSCLYWRKQFKSHQGRFDNRTSIVNRIIHPSLNQNISLKKKIENKDQNIQIVKNQMRILSQSLLDAVETSSQFLCLNSLQTSSPNSPTSRDQQAIGKSGFYNPKILQKKEPTSLIKNNGSVKSWEMDINHNMTNLCLLYPLIGGFKGNKIMKKIKLDEDTLHEAIYQS